MHLLTDNPSQQRAAAYIRYSSEMQDESFSLEAQERQIRRKATQDQNEIVEIFTDHAQSAYHKKIRPGITNLLEGAQMGLFDIVYVHKVDRLARKLEWAIDIVKKLQEYGVALKAVEQNFDLETPDGKLFFHMLASLGEFYSDNLSQETHKGKYERVQQGYHNGVLPFGYKSVKNSENKKVGQLITELQSVIEGLFTRYATGNYSDQQMADWLNEQGHRRKDGKLFTKDNMRDMLQNIYFAGKVRFRGTKNRFAGKNYRAMQGEVYEGKHDAAISIELYQTCQQVRADRGRTIHTRQKTRHIYFVNSIIVCKHCGRNMRAQSSRTNLYYREASKLSGYDDCPMLGKSVQAALIDTQIGRIMQLLRLPDNWELDVKSLLREEKDSVNPKFEIERIRKEIREMREMKRRGLYDGEEHVFWRDVENLQEELSRLKAIKQPSINQAANTLLDIQAAWKQATRKEQEELVKMLLKKVGCDIEQSHVAWIIPKPTFAPLFHLMDMLIPQEDGKWLVPQSLTDGELRDK